MKIDKDTSFILQNGEYKEIPISELIENGKLKTKYEKRRFIKSQGYYMEVDETAYKEHLRQRNRENYLKREAEAHNEFSYNAADADEYSGEELIVDVLTNVEDEVVRECMIETIAELVSGLSDKERELVHVLFYENLTEREYAARAGIPHTSINHRKRRILTRLKKMLEN